VGFIGLGNMGAHMAQNLIKNGHPLVVHDVNEASTKALQQKNQGLVKIAKNPKDVASQVTTIITMLPSSPHVQQVYCNADTGILSVVKENSLLIDASTIDPNVARDVSQKAKEKKAILLDAPVSGGVGGAEKGTLTFMVGGTKEEFERAKEVLQFMGKNIVHCGGSGNGQVVKVCNNLALAIEMIGISEAMNLGVSLGMDPKVLAGIFNTSTSRCWSSDTYNPVPGVMENVPSSRGYTGGFGTALMHKDMGLATDAARAAGQHMPLAALTQAIYAEVIKQGDGGKDFSYVYEFLAKHAPK